MVAKLEVVRGRKPMSIRLGEQETQELQQAATLSDKSMGAFIRAAALKAAQRVIARSIKAAA